MKYLQFKSVLVDFSAALAFLNVKNCSNHNPTTQIQ